MKQNMPSYIANMAKGDLYVLEEIINDKYEEFVNCYWALKEYSKNVVSIEYFKRKRSSLTIAVVLKDIDYNEVVEKLSSYEHCKIRTEITDNGLVITMKKK